MKLTEKLKTNMKGFTIIEVMIVLAIAGLIIAVVLVAVPQLQRNQRNEARRSILNRIKTEIDNYSGNNQGKYPVQATTDVAGNFGSVTASGTLTSVPAGNSFVGRYLSGVDVNDPNTGRPGNFTTATGTLLRGDYAADTGYRIVYARSAECGTDGTINVLTGSAQSDRKYALSIGLDGGAAYCIDNK